MSISSSPSSPTFSCAARVVAPSQALVIQATATTSALALLKDYTHIVLVGAKPPVGFFAYPGKPSLLAPPDCEFSTLAAVGEDIVAAL